MPSGNTLTLETQRTKLVHFTSGINNFVADKSTDHESPLGIQIDLQLKWKHYFYLLAGKLSSVCYSLRYLIENIPFRTAKMVCFAHFNSMLWNF